MKRKHVTGSADATPTVAETWPLEPAALKAVNLGTSGVSNENVWGWLSPASFVKHACPGIGCSFRTVKVGLVEIRRV
jgi:hypothetical protein